MGTEIVEDELTSPPPLHYEPLDDPLNPPTCFTERLGSTIKSEIPHATYVDHHAEGDADDEQASPHAHTHTHTHTHVDTPRSTTGNEATTQTHTHTDAHPGENEKHTFVVSTYTPSTDNGDLARTALHIAQTLRNAQLIHPDSDTAHTSPQPHPQPHAQPQPPPQPQPPVPYTTITPEEFNELKERMDALERMLSEHKQASPHTTHNAAHTTIPREGAHVLTQETFFTPIQTGVPMNDAPPGAEPSDTRMTLNPKLLRGTDMTCSALDDISLLRPTGVDSLSTRYNPHHVHVSTQTKASPLTTPNNTAMHVLKNVDIPPPIALPPTKSLSLKHTTSARKSPMFTSPNFGSTSHSKANHKKVKDFKIPADPERYEDSLTRRRRWVRTDGGPEGVSIARFLGSELITPSNPPKVEEEVQKGIANFLSVPFQLEKYLSFGVCICSDAFLHVITYLPLRAFLSLTRCTTHLSLLLLLAVSWPIPSVRQRVLDVLARALEASPNALPSTDAASPRNVTSAKGLRAVAQAFGVFHRTHGYDLIRIVIIALTLVGLQAFNMSRVYHYIRGQATIKLYVIVGIVEVFDRLLSSFGQDVLDSLYWTVRTNPRSLRMLYEPIVAFVYVYGHSAIFFVHVATLNVAVNSADSMLMTLLISNNFAEIKSFVFKKFDQNNLFQVACSDVTERFKLAVFLLIVLVLNLVQSAELDFQVLANFAQQTVWVFLAEVFADWIKHAFITKFNYLSSTLYGEFSFVLARDVTETRQDSSKPVLDHTHSIVRRIGLAQLPLACIFLRFVQDGLFRVSDRFEVSGTMYVFFASVAFIILFQLKILTGIIIAGQSAEYMIKVETGRANSSYEKSPALHGSSGPTSHHAGGSRSGSSTPTMGAVRSTRAPQGKPARRPASAAAAMAKV